LSRGIETILSFLGTFNSGMKYANTPGLKKRCTLQETKKMESVVFIITHSAEFRLAYVIELIKQEKKE